MPAPRHWTGEDLVRSLHELRALARRIEPDPSRADDLVQDLCLAVLKRPPLDDRSALPWFQVVLRRLRWLRRRADERRAQRERAVIEIATEVDRSATERSEVLADVMRAVTRLREPYRSTLTRRYLLGLDAEEIARQDGVPLRTVHTRTSRGLAEVRERLVERRGLRVAFGAWCGHVAARWRRASFGARAATGVGAVAMLGVFVAQHGAGARDESRLQTAAVPSAADAPPDARRPSDAAAATRHEEAPVEAAPQRPAFDYRGVVVDAVGMPVPSARVRFEPGRMAAGPGRPPAFQPDATGASGEPVELSAALDGSFALELPWHARGRVVALANDSVAVVAERIPEGGARRLELVVAPRRRLTGLVHDERGVPVGGARVGLEFGPSAHARESRLEGTWNLVPRATTTDANGAFSFDDASLDADDRLTVEHADHGVYARTIGIADRHVDVALEPRATPSRRIRGRVVNGLDEPIPDATVAAALRATTTRPDGSFVLDLPEHAQVDEVVAVLRGRLPARARLEADAPLVLRIVDDALCVRGRVVDALGRPVAHAGVLIGGAAPLAQDAVGSWFVEHVIAAASEPYFLFVAGDAEGKFTLRDLDRRAYRLRGLDAGTLADGPEQTIDLATAANAEITLRVDASDARAELRGRVVDRTRNPIAGASVRVRRLVADETFPDGSPARGFLALPGIVSSGDGAFRLERVPTRATWIEVQGDGLFTRTFPVGELTDGGDLVVARRVCLQVELPANVGDATSFEAFDAAGRQLRLEFPTRRGPTSMHSPHAARGALRGGRSEPFFTSDAVALVIARAEDRVVSRIAVTPRPTGITVVGP